jgi:hypothetical protein
MNVEILNWPGLPWEGDYFPLPMKGVKKTGRDEPVGVEIHISMETTERISLCNYFYLKLEKTPCFSNYVLCFFFYKIREQVLPGGKGDGTGGRG